MRPLPGTFREFLSRDIGGFFLPLSDGEGLGYMVQDRIAIRLE